MATVDAYGRDARLLFRRQAVAATDETAGNWVSIPFERFTFSASGDQERVADNPSSRFPSPLEAGLRRGSGEVEVMVDVNWIGWLLYQFFGQPVTSDDGGGDYTHVFEVDPTTLPPYGTFAVEHQGLATPLRFRHGGVAFNELNIAGAKSGRPLMMSFGGFSLRETAYDATLDATPVERPARETIQGWRITTAVSGISGGAAGLTGFSARLSNGLELDFDTQTGTAFAAKVDPAGNFAGDGEMSLRLQTRAQYDAAVAGTLLTVTQTWEKAANKSLSIVYRNVRLAEQSPPVAGAPLIEASFPWQFDAPPAGQSPVTVTLKNQTASYANPA